MRRRLAAWLRALASWVDPRIYWAPRPPRLLLIEEIEDGVVAHPGDFVIYRDGRQEIVA
jgi:hypothetical protein